MYVVEYEIVKINVGLKDTVSWKQRWIETGINRFILITGLVGKCPFPALNGHHLERNKNVFSVLLHIVSPSDPVWLVKFLSVEKYMRIFCYIVLRRCCYKTVDPSTPAP